MVDYEFGHSVETTAGAEAVWRLWSDVERWVDWDTSVQKVTLDGPFEPGSTGTMYLEGMPPLAFRLTEVTPGVGFTDETAIPGGVVRFAHHFEPGRVTHRVEIDGPGELGPMITEDVPEAMEKLVRLAEKE